MSQQDHATMLVEILEKRLAHWKDRLTMYKDNSYLNESQVLHEIEILQAYLKDAKRALAEE